MHGGLITSLTDTLGSLAVASKGHFMTGVSTDIGTSFVRPAGRVGDTLYGKAVVTAMGKSLAYTRVDFTNDKGTLVAYGCTSLLCDGLQVYSPRTLPYTDHTKYIGKSSSHQVRLGPSLLPLPLSSTVPPQDNVEFTEDGENLVEKRAT